MPSNRKKNNNAGTRPRVSRKGMASAGSAPLLLRGPTLSRNSRNFITSSLLTSDGSGHVRNAIDISATFSIQADFASISALFLNVKVKRITVSIIPIIRFYTAGALALVPNFAVGYDPSGTALASYVQVVELSDSLVYAGKRVNLVFAPSLKKKTDVLTEVINNTGANLGTLDLYNLFAGSANTSYAILNMVLEADFWGQK